MTDEKLLQMAQEAMHFAYAPYSGFKVGAALLTKSGKVYTGCNIENASFGLTNCAERTALFKAVSEGEKAFSKIAIVGGKDGVIENYCYPCGACRQALSEFTDSFFDIILINGEGDIRRTTLYDLLPNTFHL